MDKNEIRIIPLRCGSITVSKDCLDGGDRFYMPQARALTPLRSRVELPVYCFLIRHPKGNILVDTGLSRDISPEGVYDASAAASVMTPGVAAFYRPVLPKGEAIHERLGSLGLTPSDIDYVLLTHLDADHVCGLRHLGEAKHIICSQEDYFWSCRTIYKLRFPPQLWLSDRLETFWFKGSDFGPTRWAKDLFDDGSLILVHMPGHTEGHYGIVVRRGNRFALLCADAVCDRNSLDQMIIPGFCFNTKYQQKNIAWLREKSHEPGCAAVLSSHDPDLNEAEIIL